MRCRCDSDNRIDSESIQSIDLRSISQVQALSILGCIVLAAASTLAVAQAGHLDPTFANHEIFSDSFSNGTNVATVVALQSDGKIFVGGEIGKFGGVIRLNTQQESNIPGGARARSSNWRSLLSYCLPCRERMLVLVDATSSVPL